MQSVSTSERVHIAVFGRCNAGKSTLVNRLTGQDVAIVSPVAGTTTDPVQKAMEINGLGAATLIDTPGIKGFGTFDFEREEVGHYFREIFRISADCKYSNCSHTREPGCAVLKAVEEHIISESRYNSFLSMLEDKEEDKYRQGH